MQVLGAHAFRPTCQLSSVPLFAGRRKSAAPFISDVMFHYVGLWVRHESGNNAIVTHMNHQR